MLKQYIVLSSSEGSSTSTWEQIVSLSLLIYSFIPMLFLWGSAYFKDKTLEHLNSHWRILMMFCLLMSTLRYPDTIKKSIDIYIKCEQRVTEKHFHQVRSKSKDWKGKLLFLLAIVLSVLLRHTDSDCPFGIFKLFLFKSLWARKRNGINTMAKIWYGHLCLRGDNISFNTTYNITNIK
jgi:hypothetical protein